MSVYVIALLKITNEHFYRRYQRRFSEVFAKFHGRLLCADESPLLLEGKWGGDKIVIMSFDTEANAQTFIQSTEYSEISKDRIAGTETVSFLVKALEQSSLTTRS